jgi:hypothetical protein
MILYMHTCITHTHTHIERERKIMIALVGLSEGTMEEKKREY